MRLLAGITEDALEEHHRAMVGYLGQEDFQQTVKAFFAMPNQLVFGEETADAAYARFAASVDAQIAAAPDETQIVVAHGTVISLFVGQRAGVAAFPLWRRLGLPSFVVLDLPDMRLVAEVDTVDS